MSHPRILLQLDPDPHASSFDAIVALDAGADQLLQYAAVRPQQVTGLVHGAMFTRGPEQLRHTAIFVGGRSVEAGVELLQAVTNAFFGPLRVSVMLDANGANTTAAAAVLAASRHVPLAGATALVLAATGPVGQRAARLLCQQGAEVRLGSRRRDRAEQVADAVRQHVPSAKLQPLETAGDDQLQQAVDGADLVIAAGAAGVQLLPADVWQQNSSLRAIIDLNAIPPLGIEGMDVADRAERRHGKHCHGAIGVGGLKMKIHKTAIGRLFEANDRVLDAEEIYAIGEKLRSTGT